ncbi:MAG TPA: hypothetical protein VGV67_11635 [Solirubrobacteraceae bacterium]|nr:hypothetical protein [Solirubrobacteraceae bacterium]
MTDGVRAIVSRLGPEAELGLEVAEAAQSLIATAPGPGDVQELLAAYDAALDRLLMPAAALVAYGGPDASNHVRLAIGALAAAATDRHGHVDNVRAALLARVVRVLVGIGLAYDRPEAALAVAGFPHEDATVLTASGLRHVPLFDRSANTAYLAHVTWLSERSWRRDLAMIKRDVDLAAAMGEADVLLALLQAAADPDDEVYAHGLTEPGDVAPRRLEARFRHPRQRDVLRQLLVVDEEALDEHARTAFTRLIAQHDNGRPVRTQPLLGR